MLWSLTNLPSLIIGTRHWVNCSYEHTLAISRRPTGGTRAVARTPLYFGVLKIMSFSTFTVPDSALPLSWRHLERTTNDFPHLTIIHSLLPFTELHQCMQQVLTALYKTISTIMASDWMQYHIMTPILAENHLSSSDCAEICSCYHTIRLS